MGATALEMLSLPSSRITFSAQGDTVGPWTPLMHLTVAIAIGPLKSPTLFITPDCIEMREAGSPPKSNQSATGTAQNGRRPGCALSLRYTGSPVKHLLADSRLDIRTINLRDTQTLVLTDVSAPCIQSWGIQAFRHFYKISKLVLHRSWWSRGLLVHMHALREICVSSTDLEVGGMKGRESRRLVEEIVTGIQLRQCQAGQRNGDPVPLRVVFEDCTGVNESVDILRTMAEVIFVK